MKSAIVDHSREEFENIGGEISHALNQPSPLAISQKLAAWFQPEGPFPTLRREYDKYAFSPTNYSVRFLLSHFLTFQQDKALHPEVFCWPGAWMAGEKIHSRAFDFFNKHGAPFVDREDDNGIFPRIQRGRSETQIQEVFDVFYSNVVVHTMTDEWISEPGPFKYDLSWLSQRASPSEAQQYMRRQFKSLYGLDPEDVRTL